MQTSGMVLLFLGNTIQKPMEVETMQNTEKHCRMFYVEGEKMKTNAYLGLYRVPLNRENATELAVLTEVLKSGTEAYPNIIKLAVATEEMYGALWDIHLVKKGAEVWLSYSLEVLKNVSEQEALSFLCELMQNPKMEQGLFPEDTVKRCKEIVKKRLQAAEDDKRAFAAKRCLALTAEGNGAGVCADGYLEDLEYVTAHTLIKQFLSIQRHAALYLFFCGEHEGRQILKKWKSMLKISTDTVWCYPKNYILEKEMKQKQEQKQMTQARVAMGFLLPEKQEQLYGLQVLCEVLGGSANALFFKQIREEQGLCYDVSMRCDTVTGMAFAETGVSPKQAKHTINEILRIIKEVAENGVKDNLLQQAKTMLCQRYENFADHSWAMLNFTAEQFIFGQEFDLDDAVKVLQSVTQKQIQEIAGQLVCQAVYVLSGQEGEV